jgi:hypothetical protein
MLDSILIGNIVSIVSILRIIHLRDRFAAGISDFQVLALIPLFLRLIRRFSIVIMVSLACIDISHIVVLPPSSKLNRLALYILQLLYNALTSHIIVILLIFLGNLFSQGPAYFVCRLN